MKPKCLQKEQLIIEKKSVSRINSDNITCTVHTIQNQIVLKKTHAFDYKVFARIAKRSSDRTTRP